MNLLSKEKKVESLDLEHDLPTTAEDIAFIKRASFPQQNTYDLEEYIDFLEEIGAFETKKIKKHFYEDEFKI